MGRAVGEQFLALRLSRGILLLGEHRTRRELVYTVFGVVVVVAGAVLIGIVKALDA